VSRSKLSSSNRANRFGLTVRMIASSRYLRSMQSTDVMRPEGCIKCEAPGLLPGRHDERMLLSQSSRVSQL